MTVSVTPINDAPSADNESYTVAEDGTLTVPKAAGVLVGDTDIDNTAAQLKAVLASGPSRGTLNLADDGSFVYKPDRRLRTAPTPSPTRPPTALHKAAPATVTITVTPVNDAPVATNDTASTGEAAPVNIDVLHNDTDVENSALTPTLVADAENGTVTVNADKTPEVHARRGLLGHRHLHLQSQRRRRRQQPCHRHRDGQRHRSRTGAHGRHDEPDKR